MNAQTPVSASHTSIYAALAAAQAEMGPALKDSTNPAFRSKYADLANVCAAALPALNRHGIAVIQPPYDDENGNRFVKTVFFHASGETLECRVPLIVGKNDMQGYGSAVTYARRYGLMAMAGIAPDDDDGNAAAAAAPKAEPRRLEKPAEKVEPPKADPADDLRAKMIRNLRAQGAGLSDHPAFQADLTELRRLSPEYAAQVDAEIETQKAAAA